MAITAAKSTPAVYTLDSLVSLSTDELDRLFKQSPAPALDEVSGAYEGRVLAGPFAPLNNTTFIKGLNNDLLPWKGKLFNPLNENEALGQNRIEAGVLKTRLFGFNGSIRQSVWSKDDCYVLDYDRPDNLPFIRPIRDEMKKIGPSLFLGRANWRQGTDFQLILYFALGR